MSLSKNSLSHLSNRTAHFLFAFLCGVICFCLVLSTQMFIYMSFAFLIQGVVQATLTQSSWNCSSVLVMPWVVSHCAALTCPGCLFVLLLCGRVSCSSDPCSSSCLPLCVINTGPCLCQRVAFIHYVQKTAVKILDVCEMFFSFFAHMCTYRNTRKWDL